MNEPDVLYELLCIHFINLYKKEDEGKVNNTLHDLASNITAEIKHYSLHAATYCLGLTIQINKQNCIVMPLPYYLETTFSYYPIITVQEIGDIVLKLEPESQYEDVGNKIIEGIKNKTEQYNTLRRLNEDEDELYNNLIGLVVYFWNLFW